ncbi:flagella assembly protein FlgT [Thalassotalea insulae]|uniref:Flagella assembly protein FlgT n=1 Tax=Thalassotalea insulae TaxID=2056778 RepID=A0ABQ6GSL9_9GAMM|nr:flagellar assembly protein T N-terminal domain-containing protein [Thalassotalea insulae]GLX77671.1 flagella assembly protein FlgT [Thalassotalea insulae]
MRFIAILILTLLNSHFAYGQWYQAQGQAFVTKDDSKLAKTKAIENALKKALLVAGASVSSVQQVVNGLLTQDEINIRASGTINSFELIDELHHNDTITVTIRADILPQERQCFSADYRKSLLITKSHLKNREQANIGGIYQLDKVLVKKLSEKVRHQGMYLDTKLALKNNSAFSRYNNSVRAEKIKHIAMSLADITDSQYVMFSEIEDISFANQENNSWLFWQEDEYDRHFNFAVYIYNGSNGELIFNHSYQSSAPWTFTKRAQVDVNSNTFWQSKFGSTIEQTLNDVITDIDDNMMCQPTRAKIIRVAGDEIMINIGSKHGVKVGDEFSLLHLKNFTTENGKIYAGFNVSPFMVKVEQVNLESAQAVTNDASVLGNIQRYDLAVRY